MRLVEGAEACFATASGMAAVWVALAALCGQGDRLVSSRALFGSCFVIVDEILPRFGVETVVVDGPDLEQWRGGAQRADDRGLLRDPEQPDAGARRRPRGGRPRPRGRGEGRRRQRLRYAGVQPAARARRRRRRLLGHQAHRRAGPGARRRGPRHRRVHRRAGARTSCATPDRRCRRSTRGCWSRAWRRSRCASNRQHENALALAAALETHPRVTRVLHPWLPSHPQHDLARSQMGGGGSVVTFVIDGGKDEAFRVMNALEVVDISNNLGDAKSLVTHPATTTHRRLTPEARAAVGITDGDDPDLGRAGGPPRPRRGRRHRPRSAQLTESTHGRPARSGRARSTSNRSASTSASRTGVRRVDPGLAEVPGHQAPRVLRHVGRTRHLDRDPPRGRRGRPAPTPPHTCCSGSRRPGRAARVRRARRREEPATPRRAGRAAAG